MPISKEQRSKSEIITLLNNGKNREAAQRAGILCEQYPDDPEFFLFLGIALMNGEKYDKARKRLERAVEKFPREWKLRMVLGHVWGHLGNWPHAEDAYRKSFQDAKNASPEEVAELHCSIGETLWAQQHRDDALTEWRQALQSDPNCKEAKQSLEEFTNEYGEPKAPSSVFDDLYHFMHVHQERYLGLVGRREFATIEESEAVIGVIMTGWNEFVTPHSREMNKWTTKEKSEFFAEVALDFTECVHKWKKR